MKVRLSGFVGLCVAVLLSFVLALSAVAQDKQQAKEQNIQGKVKSIAKATSTITVDTDTAARQVIYNPSTKFKYGHSDDSKAGTLDKVQMGNYISCSGAMDKGVLMGHGLRLQREILVAPAGDLYGGRLPSIPVALRLGR